MHFINCFNLLVEINLLLETFSIRSIFLRFDRMIIVIIVITTIISKILPIIVPMRIGVLYESKTFLNYSFLIKKIYNKLTSSISINL